MMGTANQAGQYGNIGNTYGNMAARMAPQAQQYGQQASQAGNQYARMATDPNSVQSYMNPYLQASLAPQLQMMDIQNAQQQAKNQAQAVGQGAFGGSRQAVMQGQNQFNNALAKQNLIGQGYNTAFNNAQQSQQFGANLGLQGLQTGLQGLQQAGNLYGQGMTGAQIGLQGVGAQQAGYSGANQAASTLGQLGQNQFAQQQAITNDMQRAGAVQQAQQQQGLDVKYQDFLKQQNYPYQQLAFASDMARGLPLSQSASSIYQAPPNAMSQAGGLGMSALGIYGMSGGFKGATGGLPQDFKRYAKGGQIGYATGGDITMMTTDQLEKLLANPSLKQLERDMVEEQLMLRRRMAMNPETSQIMAPQERAGIGAISTGDMVPEGMAGGGIVAFATGDVVKLQNLKRPENEIDLNALIAKRLATMDEGNPFAKSEEQTQAIKQQMEERKKMAPYEALAMAGLGTMAGTSQHALTNLGLGGIEGLKSYGRSLADNAADKKLLLQQQVEAEKGKYARDTTNLNALIQAKTSKDNKELGLLNAKVAGAGAAAAREATEYNRAENAYRTAVQRRIDSLIRDDKNKAIYDQNPKAIERMAEDFVQRNTSGKTLKTLGIEPISTDTGGKTPPPGTPAPSVAKPVDASKLPKVTTPAQYNGLKSGDQYVDPDGNVRTKK
jgi:hypothetical protein